MGLPLHLISGYLGAGKTTVIRRFLASTPDYSALIVNDFGMAGYDAATVVDGVSKAELRIENVPGGCLCCTSAAQLLPALDRLCANPRVQRLIIEPSGLALLPPLLDMLENEAPKRGLELRPVMVVFDAARVQPAALEKIPYWRHLADLAAIAVLNRCDLATPQAVEQLYDLLSSWTPPKLRILKTSYGALPADLFDMRVSSGASAHPRDAHHAVLPPSGTFRSEALFSLSELRHALVRASPSLARFKGVFLTDQGRFRMEVAGHQVHIEPASSGADTVAEWIGRGEEMAEVLLACQGKKGAAVQV
jgi:G3E family GTPase